MASRTSTAQRHTAAHSGSACPNSAKFASEERLLKSEAWLWVFYVPGRHLLDLSSTPVQNEQDVYAALAKAHLLVLYTISASCSVQTTADAGSRDPHRFRSSLGCGTVTQLRRRCRDPECPAGCHGRKQSRARCSLCALVTWETRHGLKALQPQPICGEAEMRRSEKELRQHLPDHRTGRKDSHRVRFHFYTLHDPAVFAVGPC